MLTSAGFWHLCTSSARFREGQPRAPSLDELVVPVLPILPVVRFRWEISAPSEDRSDPVARLPQQICSGEDGVAPGGIAMRKIGLALGAVAGLGLFVGSVRAQEEANNAAQAQEPLNVQALIERLEKAEAEIARLRQQLEAKDATQPQSLYGAAAVQQAAAPAMAGVQERLRILEQKWRAFEATQAGDKASSSARPSVKVGGRIMADVAAFDQDGVNRLTVGDIEDGADFRRVRMKVEGRLLERTSYRVEMEFAGGGRPSFTDVWIGWQQVPLFGHVKLGHFKEPFSLEELTSSRFLTFMERALPNAFAPARNFGIMAYDYTPDESWTYAIGWFRTGSDAWGDDVGDDGEQSVTARVTYNPLYADEGRYVVHLGAAYSYRNADEGAFRWRQRPEVRMRAAGEGAVPNFVDTGLIPSIEAHLIGLEAAVVYGPFSVQSEYIIAPTNQIGTGADPVFTGFYVYASYFLTGESRSYDRKHGYFTRIHPNQNFLVVSGDGCTICEGWGAWELALRWSYLDLNDELVRGGRLHDLTFGINWYLNPYTRIMFNYIHAFLDDPVFDDSDADIVAMRAQIDF